jgi:hypothetical protein
MTGWWFFPNDLNDWNVSFDFVPSITMILTQVSIVGKDMQRPADALAAGLKV